jgi:ABC-type multidrug transport system fused ATPase/permease subunit
MAFFLPSQSFKTLQDLARRAAPQRASYALVLLFSLLAAATAVLAPLLYKTAINDLVGVQVKASLDENFEPDDPGALHVWEPHQPGRVAPRTPQEALHTLLQVLTALAVLGCLGIFCNYLADNLSARLGMQLEKGVVQGAYAHVLGLPLSVHDEQTSGVLAKKVDQVDQVSPVVGIFTRTLAPELIRLVGIVIIMVLHSPLLTLIAVLPLPLYLLFSSRLAALLDHNLESYYERWQQISGRMVEVFSGIKTVKQAGAQAREAARLDHATDQAYDLYIRRERANNRFQAWEEFFVQASRLLVLSLGGWLVFSAQLTPGVIVMFVAYIDQLYAPIANLSSVSISLREHAVSAGRALRLLRLPSQASGGEGRIAHGPGDMVFEDVQFGYRPKQMVLHGLSFHLKPGTVTALVGPSGAGKTTVVDLLTGLQRPKHGRILFNGAPLEKLREQDLRREIAAVSADGAVFSGSLEWNIRYQRPGLSRAEVLRAAKAAGLQKLISRLPGGLHAKLGPGGHGLSVGERQRLQLARVLAAQPGVLLLDEATANLDFANETLVKEALKKLRGRCTLLVVAHRWSMVNWADQVLVLRDGRLVQEGPPGRLRTRAGWLRRMALASHAEPGKNPVPRNKKGSRRHS